MDAATAAGLKRKLDGILTFMESQEIVFSVDNMILLYS